MIAPSGIDLDAIRRALIAELEDIERLDKLGIESRKTVQLDQSSVGRLSRMNALQQQALAYETQRRRARRRQRIKDALERIERGEFGYCDQCGEPIARKRLELDWTVRSCVQCTT